MKQLKCVLVFFIILSGAAKGQQNHFIYIQTENKQPFYVKLDNKIYSSTLSGYLILPKLKEGNYGLAIGFPKSEWTEQSITCTLDNNDAGFLLKNFADKGWGLFNLQTLAVSMATAEPKPGSVEVVNKTDAFSNMLSDVVNDSTIRQVEVVKAEPPAPQPNSTMPAENIAAEPGSAATAVQNGAKEGVVSQAVDPANGVAEAALLVGATRDKEHPSDSVGGRSLITRSSVNTTADGTEMIFIDQSNGSADTVQVFIPVEKGASVEEQAADLAQTGGETKPDPQAGDKEAGYFTYKVTDANDAGKAPAIAATEQSAIQRAPESKAADNGAEKGMQKSEPASALEPAVAASAGKTQGDAAKEVSQTSEIKTTAEAGSTEKTEVKQGADKAAEQAASTPMINSDCKSYATEDDFLKLRKKMAAEDDDDAMILLAKKVFKTKCFTVEQVKNLSSLFLKDAGKYSFFDMTYPFVADSHNFSSLQNQLTDPYYINRFLSMIRH